MDKKFHKLILIDDACDINEIEKYHQPGEAILVVVFSLISKLKLEKKGIKAYYPDEVVGFPDLNGIGLENIERVDRICSYLDDKLQNTISQKEAGIRLLSAAYYSLKLFFDNLYSSYYILKKLLQEITAQEVIVLTDEYFPEDLFRSRRQGCSAWNPMMPALMENVFKMSGKNVQIVKTASGKRNEPWFFLQKHNLSKIKKQIIDYLSFKLKGRRPGKYNGFILKNGHDVAFLGRNIADQTDLYSLEIDDKCIALHANGQIDLRLRSKAGAESKVRGEIREIFKDAARDENYRKLHLNDDLLFEYANLCLERYVISNLGALLSWAGVIKQWLIELKPKFMLTSDCRLDLKKAYLYESIRSSGVPIVTYQEGGGAGYLDWPLFNLDAKMSDYFLVYGNGVKNSPFIKGRARVLPVGSIRLAQIRRKMKDQGKSKLIYLVLDNLKENTFQHYPYNGGYFSQTYAHQLRILDAVKQFKDVKIVIKTVRGKSQLYEKYLGDNVSIEIEPLTNILDKAGAFILDFPSTTLLECLLTDKPIALLYNSEGVKFEPNAEALLKKRIRMSSSPAEYPAVIRSLIGDSQAGSKMTREKEFVDNYCLMENTENDLRKFFGDLVLKGAVNEQ